MRIADREIGPEQPPYIIAEISANHGGDLDRALRLINAAKAIGADAVKFQAYTADTITLDCDGPEFIIGEGPWKGRRLYDLYKQCETPFEWFPELFARAKAQGIPCFASVFDRSAVDLLESLGAPAYKIASFELVDLPLIRYAASTGKPLILSTGMASDDEIGEALNAIGDVELRVPGAHAILHCVSGYPTPVEEAGLRRFCDLQLFCNVQHGISDHTTGIEVPIAATALGARIIEKHFTVMRRWITEDAAFSLEPMEFASMVRAVRNTWAALQPSRAASEDAHRPLRRSLFAVADIRRGEQLTPGNVKSIRPGAGLPPKEIDNVMGEIAVQDIARGTPLRWELIR